MLNVDTHGPAQHAAMQDGQFVDDARHHARVIGHARRRAVPRVCSISARSRHAPPPIELNPGKKLMLAALRPLWS